MKFLLRMLVSAGALFGVAYISEGALLVVDEFWPTAVIAAVVLAVVNAIVKPIVKLLALPVTILTLGLFGLVVSAAMLYIVAAVVPGLETVGFLQTVAASVIIGLVTAVAGKLIDSDD
ncbi:MAG: phage holin family protein [Anaerosomatales bacterium]|nr:phage holin family protein [Anaerosomatales bacterium]